MSSFASLVGLEIWRSLRPRWLMVSALGTLLYLAAVAPGWRPPAGVPSNMWDVVMEVARIPPSIHLMVAWTSLMSSEMLLQGERLGIDALIAVRRTPFVRALGKAVAVVATGILVGLATWLLVSGVAALSAGASLSLSEWGRTAYDPLGTAMQQAREHGPPPLPATPYLGTGIVFAYQGFMVGVLVAAIASVVQRWGKPWLCPVVAVGASFAGQLLGLSVLNPVSQAFWAAHLPSPTGHLPWVSVAPLLVALVVVAGVAGPRGIRTAQGRTR